MQSLSRIESMKIDADIPAARLAGYAYLLGACEFPASVTGGARNRMITLICRARMEEIERELYRRFGSGDISAPVVSSLMELSPCALRPDVAEAGDAISSAWHGDDDRDTLMCVLGSLADARLEKRDALRRKVSGWIGKKIQSGETHDLLLYEVASRFMRTTGNRRRRCGVLHLFDAFLKGCDLSALTPDELIRLHALDRLWYDLRREKGLGTFTRRYQQAIAAELAKRAAHDSSVRIQSALMSLTEALESENHAALAMPGRKTRRTSRPHTASTI